MEITKIPKRTVTLITPPDAKLVDKGKYQQKRVAAYCRVSTDSEEQLTSYNTQKKVYTEMIQDNKEWTLAGIYADEGISGTQAKHRDQFNKMIKDALDGKIDYIITKSVSRFARNTVECLEFVRMLKARGIGIIFEEQKIDTLKTDSELYLVIYAGFAQSESESISKNITWAKRKNFEDGIVSYHWGHFLGYKKGADGMPEIVPEEAEIIKSIFTLFLEGSTIRDICNVLTEKKAPTKLNKDKWSVSTIQRILRNEKYCGDAILQKTVTIDPITKTQKKNTGEAPMYYVHNCHTPIISRETFNRAQEELIRRNAIPLSTNKGTMSTQSRYSKYALTEVMHCAECGSRYRRIIWKRNGKSLIVWRCVNRWENGKKYCKESPTITEADLHAAIVRAINRFNEEDSSAYRTLLKVSLCDALGMTAGAEEIDLLDRRVAALNKQMLAMVEETMKTGNTLESREAEFKELSDEMGQLKAQIEAIKETAQANTENGEERLLRLNRKIEDLEKGITDYDDSVVRQIIECVRIHKDGKAEIIFGGGKTIIEQFTPLSKRKNKKESSL